MNSLKKQQIQKNNNKMKNVCENCKYQNECAWNNWSLFDEENPFCPNREEGMKQFYKSIKDK